MVKTIAGLSAQVSASAGAFFSTMDRIESEAKGTAAVVNGITATAKIGANVSQLTAAEAKAKQTAAAVSGARASMTVQANTEAAATKVQQLASRAASLQGRLLVQADTAAATAKVQQLQAMASKAAVKQVITADAGGKTGVGINLPGGLNPANIAMAVISGSIMRQITTSEAGQKLLENIDRVTGSVVLPILRGITPLVELLVPAVELLATPLEFLADGIENLIRTIDDWIAAIPDALGTAELSAEDRAQLEEIHRQIFGGEPTTAGGVMRASMERIPAAPTPPPESAAPPSWFTALENALAAAKVTPPIIPAGAPPWMVTLTNALNNLAQKTEQAASMQKSLAEQLASLQGMSQFQVQMAALEATFQTNAAKIMEEIKATTAAIPFMPAMDAALATMKVTEMTAIMIRLTAQHEAEKKKLEAMNKQLETLKKINSAQQLAANIIKSTQSPLQAFQQQMDQINQLAASGNLNADQLALASQQALQALQDSMPQAPETGPAALTEGSVAAVSLINKAMKQNLGLDVQQQIKNLMAQALEAQKSTAASAAATAAALNNLGVITPARLRT